MFRKRVLFLLITLVLVIFMACSTSDQPKSVILFIGDGMGLTHTLLAEIYAEDVLNSKLHFTDFQSRAIMTTHSADSRVTDSAAAASAMYSGQKTNNRMLSMSPDTTEMATIAMAARSAGLAVGAVTTTRVTHATPAALMAHVASRSEENSIAGQLAQFQPEVLMGGGWQHFIPADSAGSKRTDEKNLIADFLAAGYTYATTEADLKTASTAGKLLGLFSKSHMAYDIDRQHVSAVQEQPSLAEMTRVAVDVLDNDPDGFFLMVEAGRIDHAAHAHDPKAMVSDVLALDAAVEAALDYQRQHPEVLIVVTADHETGGLGAGIDTGYYLAADALEPVTQSIESLLYQLKENKADAVSIINNGLGFALTADENHLLYKHPLTANVANLSEFSQMPSLKNYVFGWAHYALSQIESHRARFGWTSYAHTGVPVITYAQGPGETEFTGAIDNTDLAKKLAKLLNLSLPATVASH
ncbi:alkaline phosphatase [bacterium]|nr:alkaline phosphatase [bacterium]